MEYTWNRRSGVFTLECRFLTNQIKSGDRIPEEDLYSGLPSEEVREPRLNSTPLVLSFRMGYEDVQDRSTEWYFRSGISLGPQV